MVNHHNN